MSEALTGVWQPDRMRQVGVRLLLAALTGVALTLAAPWGTDKLHWLRRTAEFLAGCAAWELSVPPALHLLRRRMGSTSTPALLAAAVLAASMPATAGIYLVLFLMGDRTVSVASLYAQSLGLGLVLAFARRGLTHSAAPPPTVSSSPAPVLAARDFLCRHAPLLTGRLLALEAEDRYLRIHTDQRSALVLLRLRDAVAELGVETGWQPHRSFWLAHTAGGRAERRGQSWQIVLPTGLCVPVSKSAVGAMRAAGYGPPASAAS